MWWKNCNRGLPLTAKQGIGLQGTVRLSLSVGRLWNWGGSPFLRVRGSADETISIWETRESWAQEVFRCNLKWNLQQRKMCVFALSNKTRWYRKFYRCRSITRQLEPKTQQYQKQSLPSGLISDAVPARKLWKLAPQVFQPQQMPCRSTPRSAFGCSPPPISSSLACGSHLRVLCASAVPP